MPARRLAAHLLALALACVGGLAAAPAAVAATTLTVDSVADDGDATAGDGTCATAGGVCTLRAALEELNAAGGPGTIEFAIAGAGPHQILPQTKLPAVAVPVTIDGYTQPGAKPGTDEMTADIMIELRGRDTLIGGGPIDFHGLDLVAGADGSTIRGLSVVQFRGIGIRVAADDVTVVGNHVGVDAAGLTSGPNRVAGVGVVGAVDTVIGGADIADANVLSGNRAASGPGVSDTGGTRTRIVGNLIGPNAVGDAKPADPLGGLTSNSMGVRLDGATAATVERNTISGNSTDGVWVQGGSGATIAGNVIGMALGGEKPLRNGLGGVLVAESPDAMIGGPDPADANVISANVDTGLMVSGALSTNVQVLGNLIGVDASGEKGFDDDRQEWFGNRGYGILVVGAPGVRIGAPGAGNVVAMSGFNLRENAAAIKVSGPGAAGAVLQANRIGVGRAGTGDIPLGNQGPGVLIEDAPDTLVGGAGAGEGNVIAYSGLGLTCCGPVGFAAPGVDIRGETAERTTIHGNRLGTDATGTTTLGVGGHGVRVGAKVPDTAIGGPGTGEGNVIVTRRPGVVGGGAIGVVTHGPRTRIAGNMIGADATGLVGLGSEKCGVVLGEGSNGSVLGGATPEHRNVIVASGVDGVETAADDVRIESNMIGVAADGVTPLPNAADGIAVLEGSKDARITGNVVSGNLRTGVSVRALTRGTWLFGNRIGTDAGGTAAIANAEGGVAVRANATGTVVGGEVPEHANVVSGNGVAGMVVEADGTYVLGNRIGVGSDGEPLPNSGTGILVRSSGNAIGEGAANEIRFNQFDGIAVRPDAVSNRILGNSIDDNGGLAIDLVSGDLRVPVLGVTANDAGDGDGGGNNLQNFPVLERAVTANGTTEVGFRLESLPSTGMRVDVYASPAVDATGHGEARTPLGHVDVTTDASGVATGTLTVPQSVAGFVAATATSQYADTSELSRAIAVTGPPVPREDEPTKPSAPSAGDQAVTPAPTAPAPKAPTPTPAPAPPAAPQPPSVPTRAVVADALRGGMTVRSVTTARTLLRDGGVRATFAAPGPGGVRIDWRVGKVLVARGKAHFTQAGRVTVRVKLTPAGTRLLRRARGRTAVTIQSRFSGPGMQVTAQRRATLRR